MRGACVLAAAAVLASAAAGCGEQESGYASVPGLEEDFGTPRQSASVDMRNIEYAPQRVALRRGARVTWLNRDRVAHTVTVGTELNSRVDSGEVAPGESFSRRFDQPGDVEYRCTIHTQMRGTLRVAR